SEGGPAAPTATVAALLPAPDLGSLAGRFDRPVVRFTVAGVDTALRIQIAADPAFDQIVSDQRVAVGAEVRIAGLGDATWYLRARRIGAQGIEGLDTVRPLVLSARPEPPAYLRPRGYATQGVGDIDFAWAPNVDAPRTQIQVATDPGFEHIVIDRDALDAASLRAVLGTPGTYHWRLASVRPDGSHGPFGDPQTFTLRPAPPSPTASRSADGGLVFNWGSRPGVHYQVEFARDTAFADVVGRGEVDGSQWTSPPVAGGRYYFRYRSLEPDGFVTPFSETVQVDIPHDWSGVGVLVPVLLFLL
ncbi:MAG: hypothetical protein M3O01_16730, partial [Pseudomonadota bacterium]|nr:hypothetical protein [Pseudomonadota bacterium]